MIRAHPLYSCCVKQCRISYWHYFSYVTCLPSSPKMLAASSGMQSNYALWHVFMFQLDLITFLYSVRDMQKYIAYIQQCRSLTHCAIPLRTSLFVVHQTKTKPPYIYFLTTSFFLHTACLYHLPSTVLQGDNPRSRLHYQLHCFPQPSFALLCCLLSTDKCPSAMQQRARPRASVGEGCHFLLIHSVQQFPLRHGV